MDCSSSSVLSDDDFTLDGTPYTFNQIQMLNTDNGGLLIGLLPALTVSAAELTLMVDGTAFAFEDADEGTNTFTWSSTGLSWTAGQSVSLSLTHTPLPTPTPTITYEGREPAGGFRVKVTWSEAVEGFMEIDEGTGYQHDLHAGYNGGPGVFIKTFEEMTAGLVYTAVVPVAPPSGTPKMAVSVLPGAATALVGGQENMAGHLLLEVDGAGYPVTVLLPVVQQVEIVPPGGRGSSSRSAFPTHSAYSGRSTFGSRSVEASPEVEVNWTAGENVEARMTFSEPVTVDLTDGTPTLGLVVAGQERSARYSDGSGTHTLTFGYEVIEEDGTVTAVSVTANSLALNGATICNSSGVDADLTHPGASLGGTDEPPPSAPLTASFTNAPPEHDGQSAFSFRVAFSEDIGISYQTLRDESFTTTGGAVTGAPRVGGRHDLWEITVEPSGAENVTITLAGGRACGTTGAVCTREDTPRTLTNSPSATVKGPSASGGGPPSAALTASFSGVPDEHTGESFTFGLTFSEDVAGLSYKTLRDSAFSVTNGQVTRARRQTKGSNKGWTITVEPDSHAAVTVTLPAGSVETADGRGLERAVSATVNGPGGTLSFAHFANGDGVTSEVVIVNVAPQPIRPRLSFYDPEGNLMDPQSLLDMLGDLEITEDGAVRVRTEIEPLGELAIATHGRGPLRSGSVKVGSGGSVGGMLRFDLPGIGETVVGPGQPTNDAIFPVRRREGGINTWVAIHNLESSPGLVRCELLRQGVLLDAVVLPLAANGQTSWTIDEAFQAADTSDFVGSVRCTALGEGQFTAMAVELDAGNGIFTTLPLVPVSPGGETTLEFAHLPNGDGLTSEVVLVNVASHAIRPTLYFFDPQGEPIAAESLLEVGGDLAIQADGGLTVWREMEPLGELAISTHGRGPLLSGSVKVMSDGPIGGFLRFHLPGVGVAGVGASQPMRDAIFPVRRREGGTHTGVVLRNLSETELALTGRLMKKGAVLEEVEILLEGGQEAWYIEERFTGTDMSDFEGSVRFTAVGEGQFTGMAVELDAGNRIFTTLPVMPVTERMSQE